MDQDLALLIHSSFHLRQGGNLTDEVSTAEGLLETSARTQRVHLLLQT